MFVCFFSSKSILVLFRFRFRSRCNFESIFNSLLKLRLWFHRQNQVWVYNSTHDLRAFCGTISGLTGFDTSINYLDGNQCDIHYSSQIMLHDKLMINLSYPWYLFVPKWAALICLLSLRVVVVVSVYNKIQCLIRQIIWFTRDFHILKTDFITFKSLPSVFVLKLVDCLSILRH